MYIGELSKKTGVSIKAIRHYEEIGLIKSPQRKEKYRIYDNSYLDVLTMIQLAKRLGFTLSELKNIAQAKTEKGLVPMDLLTQKITEKRQLLLQQQETIAQKLAGLIELEQSVAHYNACLLESLVDES
ncbi:MerR family transcriptional regulator [Grimontia sp. S25]|uniref:MerR family transcriptional regulator n=1 Tax=Grimontia sedimenti TaxID=2711294 RepID=A0A6M1RAM4_9GAMM|nr:MerR family transcriptional regulator [Grimontia sedimenti]NGN99333.1 MerR family transcriptional regulator [Grimontia sedimenti]